MALFGSGALFKGIASPLIIRIAEILSKRDPLDSADLPLWLPLLFFMIAIWSIRVMGHIFSRTMIKDASSSSSPPISGGAIALLYKMINFLVHSSFLGERFRAMHIHILGIGGTFRGSLAVLAKQSGHHVTGPDINGHPPIRDQWEERGMDVIPNDEVDQLK
jgi:UDP-N-acetylmuramate-alanine ligase